MDHFHLSSHLIETIPAGLLIWHLVDLTDSSSFRLVTANAIARKILDLPASLALPNATPDCDPFPSFFKLELPDLYADIIRNAQAKDVGEVQYRDSLGTERVFLLKAFPLPEQHLGVLLEDITANKYTEKALRQSEQKLLLHFQQSPLAIIEWNLDFEVVAWNPMAERIFGYSQPEVLGKQMLRRMIPTEAIPQVQQVWMSLLQRKRSLSHTIKNIAQDGKTIVCEWRNTPLMDEPDNIIGIISLIQETTQHHQTEADLRQFAEQLEQNNRELQDFAVIASHDLQEPLRKIVAFSDRLQAQYTDTLAEEGRDYLRRIQACAQRMQSLIQGLLMLARVTTKAQPFVAVNLNQVAQEVLSDLEICIQQVNGRVDVKPLPTLEADPLQMRQLLQNLVSNALKFHQPDVAPIVQLRSEIVSFPPKPESRFSNSPSYEPPLQYCQLEVIDNGIGFDPKYRDRIFSAFQRLHGRSEYEGTGIGLAICYKIVERHGGEITARSQPGEGATFQVLLPLQQSSRFETRNR